MWKCRALTVWRTTRYGLLHAIATGHVLLGHDFQYTGEVHYDQWVMECSRCHVRAAIDEKPPTKEDNGRNNL